MHKLGKHRTAFKIQRALMNELPGLGKAGALVRREYPPGQHGFAKKKFSEYSLRLREKQKLMLNYCLREEQLRRFVKTAKSGKNSNWMATLVANLESRLDAVVFRLGFAKSIPAARQLICHRKVKVNGKLVTIGSAIVPVGAVIQLTDSASTCGVVLESIKNPRLPLPDWLELIETPNGKTGKLKEIPPENAVPFTFDARLVVEYYSGL